MVGWRQIGPHPAIAAWAEAARPLAIAALAATDQPLRCGGTWAVGLDLLPNAPDGSLSGTAFPWQAVGLAPEPLHKGQISTVYPDYPRPSPDETDAAYRFRLNRDAAHLDGLLAIGEAKRRMVKEPHAWILGLPLTECSADAAPLVVWENSHLIIRAALRATLSGHPPETWGDIDVTEPYQSARAEVFKTCRRIELPVSPGQATLLHRLTIHGVTPWSRSAKAPPEGRIIAYFRPLLPSVQTWLEAP